LKIIPVIDILNGAVVHAVRGKRKEYKPLKSSLCESSEPVAVASAFRACGFEDLYVADLDAIISKTMNLQVLKKIAEKTGLRLMVDAGISNFEQAKRLFQCEVSQVIFGTETFPNLVFVRQAIESFGKEKIVVSLDLQEGKVMSKSESLRSIASLELAKKLQDAGVCELIVLDLARVGSGEGVDFALIEELVRNLKMNILVGGGIRNKEDLKKLEKLGVYGVLLATSLHSGKLTVDELRAFGLIANSVSTAL
jgi:phosphoribosylformimino-5-aminoimidazole carboxamide ribotide isomerase